MYISFRDTQYANWVAQVQYILAGIVPIIIVRIRCGGDK